MSEEDPRIDVSVVIPLFNEEESLVELATWIDGVMKANSFIYEAIFVDDGSKDSSWDVITNMARTNTSIRGIRFRRNSGKSSCSACGFSRSSRQSCDNHGC